MLLLALLCAAGCARAGFGSDGGPGGATDGATGDTGGGGGGEDAAQVRRDGAGGSEARPPRDLGGVDVRVRPDSTPAACPPTMAAVGGFCIDKQATVTKSWVGAAALCMNADKRLCHAAEWSAACLAKAAQDMGAAVEWINDLQMDGKRAATRGLNGCGSGDSASVHDTVGRVRCCKTQGASTAGMVRIGTFYIDRVALSPRLWTEAAGTCMALGRRLCRVAEWSKACIDPSKPLGMLGAWEWLGELSSPTAARKAGATTCTGVSAHDVLTAGYETRCCFRP